MKILVGTLFGVMAFAQATGTITKTTATNIRAIAGTMTCNFISNTPNPSFTFQANCVDSANPTYTQNQSAVLPEGASIVGSNVKGSDNITWTIQHKVGQPNLAYQIAANSVSDVGTF